MFTRMAVAATMLLALTPAALTCEKERVNLFQAKVAVERPLQWSGPEFRPLRLNLSDGQLCEIGLGLQNAAEFALQLKRLATQASDNDWTPEIHRDSPDGSRVDPVAKGPGKELAYRL